ncbi:MAG: hypothetical protein ABIJ97_13440 [Bacteroidota bacterium]
MKKLFLFLIFIIFYSATFFSQTEQKNTIKDGLYLVDKLGNDSTQFDSLKTSEIIINFSHMFLENDKPEFTKLLIDTTEFVQLELEKLPSTEHQNELKANMMLSLTKEASENLEAFTSGHIMRKVALVVDGEAITVHKIREAITTGELQITRCDKNTCEQLIVKLKDNVKK